MSVDWGQHVKDYFDDLPHPKAPSVKIKDFATAVKLASMAKFGGHASAHEAALFWPEFKASGLSPQEFEHALDRLAPLSYTYHGRPPSIPEIMQLKDRAPHEARKYFSDLPDKHFPHLSSGEMIKAMQAARPWSREHLDREPVKTEAAYLHHSGENPAQYYKRLAGNKPEAEATIPVANELQTEKRGDASGRSVGVGGRSQTNQ